ncbi:MAG: LLM class F420-dependent oxidoreductase [Gammaproteobacteria bacterium]|nr:LLM class F420-dependent oxidoreductase [Gammaproteobacteria bacterium]
MRIGLMIGADSTTRSIDDLVALGKRAESLGFASVWMANIFSFDAITALTLIGRDTKKIQLGTAVVPTYPRHPTALAQQALTAASATGNRFNLGIGLSHQVVIENMLGFSYAKPARHMREYLSVLGPLLRGETVNFDGDEFHVHGVTLAVPGARKVPIIVAALGPAMLKLTGALADGTTTWMVGPKTMSGHIIPTLTAAAKEAGRPAPTVVGGFPIVLTNKPDEAREAIAKQLTIYGQLPSYRAMLDREGVKGPADIAIAGDENALRGEIKRLESIGITDFTAAIAATDEQAFERTLEFLSSLN